MALATNAITPGTTKHIDILYHFIHKLVKRKTLASELFATSDILSFRRLPPSLPS